MQVFFSVKEANIIPYSYMVSGYPHPSLLGFRMVNFSHSLLHNRSFQLVTLESTSGQAASRWRLTCKYETVFPNPDSLEDQKQCYTLSLLSFASQYIT